MEHQFNVDIARQFGIEEAIIIQNLFYWIDKNAANKVHEYDGYYWTYNSTDAFTKQFPYMKKSTIYRVLQKLEKEGVIKKGNYNKNHFDRTCWYAFTEYGMDVLQKCNIDVAKMKNGNCKNETPIPYNNTNNKQEETINIVSKKNPIDYQAIVDCWNEHNGKHLGKVTMLTQRRKDAIKKIMSDHNLDQEKFKLLLTTIPYADKWLYNPKGEHKNWKPDFNWWMANHNGWFTKLAEGGVHKENPQMFNAIMQGKETPYTPQGRTIWFNKETKSYWSDDNFYYESISDGYEDDNRPDGATLTLNNARGNIKWNAQTKKWEKV